MNEKSENEGDENGQDLSLSGLNHEVFLIGLIPTIVLVLINIIAHTLYVGSGLFNTETPPNLSESLISGMVIYILIVGIIALVVSYLRNFSFKGVGIRFKSYFIYLQLFFILTHLYQIIADWIGR